MSGLKIALIDVDNVNRRKIKFPNLPLMKISAYHKARGDTVSWWNGFEQYDIVYTSKVFEQSPNLPFYINADSVIYGGTGYDLTNRLPDKIEHTAPDYTLYPQFTQAYGFLTRGCPRNCPFCCVTGKEGKKSVKVADLSEFWSGQRVIKLLDPNMLACADHEALLQQLIDSGAWIDFTQGLDIRLTTPENTALLGRVRVKSIHFAWDDPKEDLTKKFERFKQLSEITDYRKLGVYVLVNYNSTHEEDIHRIVTLRDLGFSPYVMIYDKDNAPRRARLLQRWVNNRIIFAAVKDFEDFDARRG